jgi:hypothetical protein
VAHANSRSHRRHTLGGFTSNALAVVARGRRFGLPGTSVRNIEFVTEQPIIETVLPYSALGDAEPVAALTE